MSRLRMVLQMAWPLLAAAFFIPFGSDLVIGYVVISRIRGPLFFLLPCIAATMDIIFWYWFLGWGSDRIANARGVHAIIEEFRAEGMSEEVSFIKRKILNLWVWFVNLIEQSTNPQEGWKHKVAAKLINSIRRYPPALGYVIIATIPTLLGIGIFLGIIVCRTTRLPKAFHVLWIGNCIKVLLITLIAYFALH